MFQVHKIVFGVVGGSLIFTSVASAQNCTSSWDFSTNLHDPGLSSTAPGAPRDGTEIETVNTLVSFDDGTGPALYAGGIFTWAGGNPIGANIAKWDGSQWSTVFVGTDSSGWVSDLLSWNDGTGEALYVSGKFSFVGGITPANGVAKWDGSQWSAVGSSNAGSMRGGEMVIYNDGNGEKLYMAAVITAQDNTVTRGVYRLDGNAWTLIGQPSLRGMNTLISYDDGNGAKLYSTSEFLPGDAGPFEEAIRVLQNGQWVEFGNVAMTGSIKATYVWDDGTGPALYASGPWWTVDNLITPDFTGFGKWNGTSWTPVGGGFEPGTAWTRNMMAWDDGTGEALYLTGTFGARKWTGTTWVDPFDMGIDVNPFGAGVPSVMYPFDDGNGRGLFFAGDFESVRSLDANNLDINTFAMSIAVYRGFDPGTCNNNLLIINEDTILLPADGAMGDEFGNAIDIDNGLIAIGAHTADDNGAESGSVYLFDASSGAQVAKLLPNDGAAGDEFGYAVAIDNGIVAVGARYDGDNGSLSGSAYLFDASSGTQLAKLLPNDGAPEDLFGFSIAIDGGIVVVGSRLDDDMGNFSGSAYLFDAATGVQLAKLLPNDGAAGDEFGFSVAIDNGIVAVGSVWDDTPQGVDFGSAYLFDAATGQQLAKLVANDGASADRFGASIAIDAGTVVVGSMWNDDRGNATGSAYLFDASTGALRTKILPSDSIAGDWLGFSVSIDSGIVAIGAPRDADNGESSGSGYLFDASTGSTIAKMLPTDGAPAQSFGQSIAIKNGAVAVGASTSSHNGLMSGSAYRFTVPGAPCPADMTGDGVLNFFDVSAFLAAFTSQDPSADFTGDGQFNFFDVSAFLAAFSGGCP